MKFNAIDAKVTFGMLLSEKAYDAFESDIITKPDETAHSWPDESGTQTDKTVLPVFERRTYSIPMIIEGQGKADLYAKYNAFADFFKTVKEFNLDLPDAPVPRRYKLQLSKISGFRRVGFYTQNGQVACRITLTVTDDYPVTRFPIT